MLLLLFNSRINKDYCCCYCCCCLLCSFHPHVNEIARDFCRAVALAAVKSTSKISEIVKGLNSFHFKTKTLVTPLDSCFCSRNLLDFTDWTWLLLLTFLSTSQMNVITMPRVYRIFSSPNIDSPLKKKI